jgi:hypothetical protein
MHKQNEFDYLVSSGETVTVTVDCIKVGPRVTATLDGLTCLSTGPHPKPTFVFVATKPVGYSHHLILDFDFFPLDDDDAQFEVTIDGNQLPASPPNPPFARTSIIKKSHAIHQAIYNFEVHQ